MPADSVKGILRSTHIFDDDHVPDDFILRGSEINELLYCITPLIRFQKPINVWIYGKPGTGKTLVCQYVLKKLKQEHGLVGLIVNCWENNTFFSVIDKMIRDFRLLGAERLMTSFKLERLKAHVRDKSLVIFLDEIDRMPRKDREDVLYNLCMFPSICIVSVSISKYVLYELDERIKSRLAPRKMRFGRYSIDELAYMLEQITMYTLKEDSYDQSILQRIAVLSKGDARTAIQTLKNAAYQVESGNRAVIRIEDIEKAHTRVANSNQSNLLNQLTKHHRLLYDIIKESEQILSGELWQAYLEKCTQKKIRPMALRTYSEYMNKLIMTGLIKSERALVKGKVRRFTLPSNNHISERETS